MMNELNWIKNCSWRVPHFRFAAESSVFAYENNNRFIERRDQSFFYLPTTTTINNETLV